MKKISVRIRQDFPAFIVYSIGKIFQSAVKHQKSTKEYVRYK